MSCKKTNLFELNFVPQIDESSAFTSCASFKSVLCLLALRTKQYFLLGIQANKIVIKSKTNFSDHLI